MGLSCSGICERYRFVDRRWAHSFYLQGAKRCQVCSIFIVYDGKLCPCCHTPLRSRPHAAVDRERFKQVMGIREIE